MLTEMHRFVITKSVELVDTVRPADMNRETPCAGWNLSDLLAHMTVQHRGFAAAARGSGQDLAVWRAVPARDPVRAYSDAAQDVMSAFADASDDAPFALPEFGPGAVFPGAMAMGFHFIDYVVHGWDVAATLHVPFELPADVVDAALRLALGIPDGDFRTEGAAPFARAVEGRDDGDFNRILRHLGRRPEWAQPYSTVTGA